MLEKIFVFLFGSILGNFLNVCIYRMPLGQSIVKPRSFCPHCKKTILWYDNVPLLSYIFLGGLCRFCKQRINIRYFIVELLTAAMFLLFYNRYGLSFTFLFYIIFICGLTVATFVDIQHRIIPDEISFGGIIVGFLLAVVRNFISPVRFDFSHPIISIIYNPPPLLDSFLGILLGGGIIYYTGKGFDLVWFKLLKKPPIQGETESMGGGDVKLLAMIGAFLGWQKALVTFFLAPFFGVVIGIFNLLLKKDHTIPYGPFLSLAALFALFWADKIFHFLFFVR